GTHRPASPGRRLERNHMAQREISERYFRVSLPVFGRNPDIQPPRGEVRIGESVMRSAGDVAERRDLAWGRRPRMTRSLPTIVVADDDAGIVRIVSRVLELNNFNVVTCSDGAEALKAIHEQPPALALLDIRMPGMDGITLCQQLRSESDLPVI